MEFVELYVSSSALGLHLHPPLNIYPQAFQNLMMLHVLFIPAIPDPDGPSPSPLSSMLALTLDDEVQHRCAGFVQAEIERFAEELVENGQDDGRGHDDDEEGSERSGSEDDEPGPSRKKKGGKTTKKGAKKGEISQSSFRDVQESDA